MSKTYRPYDPEQQIRLPPDQLLKPAKPGKQWSSNRIAFLASRDHLEALSGLLRAGAGVVPAGGPGEAGTRGVGWDQDEGQRFQTQGDELWTHEGEGSAVDGGGGGGLPSSHAAPGSAPQTGSSMWPTHFTESRTPPSRTMKRWWTALIVIVAARATNQPSFKNQACA